MRVVSRYISTLIEMQPRADLRGDFAQLYSPLQFAQAGIAMPVAQVGLSRNPRRGTLRGLHYRPEEDGEGKLVRCIRGRIWDVVVDLRPHSATFLKWRGAELSGEDRLAQYIPPGCAHGFISLEDESEVLYLLGAVHVDDRGLGVRWDDPSFAIAWPSRPEIVLPRDAQWPDYRRASAP